MKKKEALDILGLADGATDDAVKKAHRAKVRATHPDQFTDAARKAEAEEQTKLVNEARDVLLNRSWDPDFGPRAATGGTYRSPYTYTYTRPGGTTGQNPYTDWPFTGAAGSAGGGSRQDDPFADIPFTYVWTSWDNVGGRQGGPRTASSADPFDFASIFTGAPRKSAEEYLAEARDDLRRAAVYLAVKVAVLVLCAALGGLAAGMYAYVIASMLYALTQEMEGCSTFFAIPIVVLFGPLLLFAMPSFGQRVNVGSVLFFAFAVVYDVGVFRRLIERYRTLRDKANIPTGARK